MRLDEGEYLAHYGILRKSGRYPWGSGANKLQRSKTFLDIVDHHMKVDGMSEAQIAKAYDKSDEGYPLKTQDIRALRSRAGAEVKRDQIRTATKWREKGMGTSEIGRRMGVNESTVRSLLEPGRLERLDILQSTADMLKREVEEKEYLDVGAHAEKSLEIGISPDKFKTSLSLLKEEGYNVHNVPVRTAGTGETIKYLILTKPGVTQKDAFTNRDKIRQIAEKSDDRGRTWTDLNIQPPIHIDPKRVGVRYKEEGGADADGVIYVRPGVKDTNMGKSNYAQVRIAVGGTHYLKGMAIYKDDLPKGIDLQFNTNKSDTGNKLDALKPLKKDKETGEVDQNNPFGAVIKKGGQILDKDGKVSSAMNLINEEGDWDTWSNNISRQVLSKQSPDLAKSQLDLTYERRREEYDKIKSLTNPQVKKKLLETFADGTDSSAVHLKAASMPSQATKVLLPSNHVKPHEVFAPTFENGERIALVRFPHAGTFEIPELTVNNKSREIRKMFGGTANVPDAIVIHPKVAEHLSGADFDGDHVIAIPNRRGAIAKQPPLEGLKDFDPQKYAVPRGPVTKKFPDGTPSMTPQQKGYEMGNVTNLIADMTVKGANNDELARAVRHSMVVIDAEKHNLDYKASYRDHAIADLKRTYQGVTPKGGLRGASTLITRATAQEHVDKRKAASAGPGVVRYGKSTIDVATGKKVYEKTGELKPDGTLATQKSKRLAETPDARTLLSDQPARIEHVYADHSNRLKSLANEARRELVTTENIPRNKSAAKEYANEVASLDAKLRIAEKNAPLERQAQVVAGSIYSQIKRANPDMEKDEERKIKGQALAEARIRTGSAKVRLGSEESPITDREWQAIQAGAISNHKLERILNNADLDKIRERATPREKPVMTDATTARAKQMLATGYTLDEVSQHLGIALSTLKSGVE